MRLYKAELYKLCHRKIFIIGFFCTIVIQLLYFLMKVSDERSYVDGTGYYGYEAVQINRRITEEFKGIITDEKAEKIIEKYGFPRGTEDYCGYYTDANYLNGWVEKYLSNGHFWDWHNYELATHTLPIADTGLGAVREATGKEIILEYSDGWLVFLEDLQLALLLGSILVLFTVSGIFAGEKQAKMIQLLFTTKEGRLKDIYIKIGAALTVSIGIWLVIVLLDFLLCGMIYGFDGLDCMAGTTGIGSINTYVKASMVSMSFFVGIVLLYSLMGILLLCAVTMCLSAQLTSSFHTALISALLCWAAPVLFMFLWGLKFSFILQVIKLLVYASPIYAIMFGVTYDVYGNLSLLMVINALVSLLCVVRAHNKFKRCY